VNNRARNRLVGVTAIILIVIVAIFFGASSRNGGAAYSKSVSQATSDKSLVGKRIKVTGAVVPGSWDKKSNPLVFQIRDEGKTTGPTLDITYRKGAPSTFGDDAVAIITGVLKADHSIDAEDMLTKCPDKYSSKTSAETIPGLLAEKAAATGRFVRVTGYVKAGSLKAAGESPRFVLTADPTGGKELPVLFTKATPNGFKDGASLVIGGTLGTDGTFAATEVSLAK